MIWDKLMINASSSVLSGILQVAQGYVEQDAHAWTLAEKLIRELCAAATADGHPFDAEEQIARIRLHLQKAPDGFTSIYADLKAGRRTEMSSTARSWRPGTATISPCPPMSLWWNWSTPWKAEHKIESK